MKFLRSIVIFILTLEAKAVLRRHKPDIILVSGSVGKTTTKDAMYHLLQTHFRTRKSEKSFNGEIGVPLTILGLENAWRSPMGWLHNLWLGLGVLKVRDYPELLILEVGSDHPGDIARLTKWITPEISVITRLPDVPVHVEYFESPAALREEDAIVASALPEGGVYIANADDEHAMEWKMRTKGRTVTFGFNKHAMMHGSKPEIRYALNEGLNAPVGMLMTVTWEKEHYPVFINGVLGTQSLSAVLAALAVGVTKGASMQKMVDALVGLDTPPGRMRVLSGKGSTVLIDDTYNSSPVAVEAALQTLRDIEGPRKIAILGDMLELGTYTEEEHWKAGRLAGAFVDEFIAVGHYAGFMAEAAKSAGLPQARIHQFMDAEAAGQFMSGIQKVGDVILLKGSQGSGERMIRMERAVKVLMAHAREAEKVLVRQGPEWLKQYEKK